MIECVHLVTCGHFPSRDKDGSNTIRSAIAKNPMLHTNFMFLRHYIELEVLPIEVLHCRNRDFGPFLLQWPWSDDLVYELDSYSLEIYQMFKYELPTSRLSKVTVWQTNRHDQNYIPCRFAEV